MSLFLIFINAFVIGFSGAVMPGPLLTVNISESLRKGFRAGPIVVVGHAIAEVGVLLAIYLGLTKLVSNPRIFFWIAVIGGVCLIIMGVMMLWEVLKKRVRLELAAPDRQTNGRTMIMAAVVSIASPYWILWWLTVGTLLVSQSLAFGLLGVLVFYIGHILSDLVWYSLVSFLVSRGKRYFNDFAYRILILLCALFLILLGLYFIDSAASGGFLEQLNSLNLSKN